ncbi:hypothetical protein VRRI112168_15610 [Vreelandella rituensis]
MGNAQLGDAFPDGLHVARVTQAQASDLRRAPGAGARIPQATQPTIEDIGFNQYNSLITLVNS